MSLVPERVMRKLVRVVRPQPQVIRADSELRVPGHPRRQPELEPAVGLGRWHKELHLHLLELPRPEDGSRRDLVAEGLPDLRDTERRLIARELQARS